MAEPAEMIVKEWIQKKKQWFTMENVLYKVNSKKRGSNYGDIDILAVDVKGNYYDIEVKWSGSSVIGATKNQKPSYIIDKFNAEERKKKLEEIGIKDLTKVYRILIAPKIFFGKKEKSIKNHKNEFDNKVEIIFFEDVINDLVSYSKSEKKDDSIVIRLLRSLNSTL